MDVYLTILYPALKKDPNITWQEISRRYPRYNSLSILAQQSRFSNARSIIRNGWEEDALRMIAGSRAAKNVVEIAKECLKNDGLPFNQEMSKMNLQDISFNLSVRNRNLHKENIQTNTRNYNNEELTMLLRAIGKEIFVTILYPELKKNIDVTWQEIGDRNTKYKCFSENSQRSRLSRSRTIFRNKWEIEALRNIADSDPSHTNIVAIELANKYLNETTINSENSNSLPSLDKVHQSVIRTSAQSQNTLKQIQAKKIAPIHIQEGQKGVSYKSLFADYLIDATEIIVEDPYIIFPYQIQNLIDFLSMTLDINPNMKTHLVTHFDNLKQKQEIKRTLTNLQQEIPNFSFEFKSFHDRCIKTNTGWFISMGRGLDIFQPYDKFSILCKKQENRLCKDFTVTYTKE